MYKQILRLQLTQKGPLVDFQEQNNCRNISQLAHYKGKILICIRIQVGSYKQLYLSSECQITQISNNNLLPTITKTLSSELTENNDDTLTLFNSPFIIHLHHSRFQTTDIDSLT